MSTTESAPQVPAVVPSEAAGASEDGRLTGVGGLSIFWRAWLPSGEARAVVVISHGAGEHSGRYEHVGLALASDGYAVYAIDHRGHGRSEGARALITRMDDAVEDLHLLRELARERHPAGPQFLLAHSMGGTIGLSYALAHGATIDGLVLSGPLAELEAAPAPVRAIVPVLSRLAPRLGLLAVDPTLVSRDPAVVRAYEADPLVHHDKLPARTIAELADVIGRFPETVRQITVPTWIGHGTADGLCRPSGSEMLRDRIGAADVTLVKYDGLYHEILNEPERDRVLSDVREWLRARSGSR